MPAAELEAVVRTLRAGGGTIELARTASVDDLIDAWTAVPAGRVVLVGGDGTVHTAANLFGGERDLALVPAGSANNIARSLGIPLDPRAAAELASNGHAYPLDAIESEANGNRQLVLESVSVGFLAQARCLYYGSNSGNVGAAAAAGLRALARFHPLGVRVATGDHAEELHLSQLFVANLPLYEFGLRVAPHADPSDHLLDFVGLAATSRREVVRMIARLHAGRHIGRPGVHLWRGPRAHISTHGSSPIVADSTDLGFGPVVLRAAPAALRLVRPR
jgi:diacylglycerol kinase (ATP)